MSCYSWRCNGGRIVIINLIIGHRQAMSSHLVSREDWMVASDRTFFDDTRVAQVASVFQKTATLSNVVPSYDDL